jgi:gamma-glutamyltranspeptidase/glutathione hydrolase
MNGAVGQADPQTLRVVRAELNDRPPTQIWGRKGMVTSMHPDATLAGLDILKAGGNAIDAAIAVAMTISVTSQNWAGLAGDSVWQIHLARDRTTEHLDGYSICPQAMTAEALTRRLQVEPSAFAEEPANIRDKGIATSLVPGTPAALCAAWRRYGSLPFADLCKRAIELAREGIVVNSYIAGSLEKCARKLGSFEASRAIHFDGDRPLKAGDLMVQKDLSSTIERFASGMEREFIDGVTARAIADHSRKAGGFITLEDFGVYKPVWRPCLKGSYRGYDIAVTGAPTSGIHVLQALNILEPFAIKKLPCHSPAALHLLIEAIKIALSERRRFGGDPDFLAMDVEASIAKGKGIAQAGGIDPRTAIPRLPDFSSTASSTTHFAVVDQHDNVVNATQTIGGDYGSGEVVPGTGLVMNERSWWMSLKDGPNVVAPGHRPNIGHAPTIVFEEGKPVCSLRSPGGFGIVQYVVQTLVHMIDYGLDIQTAVEMPRFRVNDLALAVSIEDRIPSATLEALRGMGHAVDIYPAWTDRVGGVEGIEKRNGNLLSGWDPRRNSLALGY